MIYISSPSISTASRQSIMQAQSALAKAQSELTSGTLADPGLSLGSGAGQLVTLSTEQNKLQTLTTTNGIASTRLTATTSALDALRTTASAFLTTLTTSGSTGTSSLASTAQSNLAALTSTLNTAVSGQYIFGGINADTQPMTAYTDSPASANKQAVDGAFSTAFGTSQTSAGASAISGTDLQSFLDTQFASLFGASSFSGSWSTASDTVISSQIAPNQTAQTSVSANAESFRQLAQAYTTIKEFSSGTLSSGATQAAISSATSLISKALAGLTNMEAGVGVTQSAISSANESMSTQISLLSTRSSGLDGVDSYALSTQISNLQTQIRASYELTAQMQQMSLAMYLA
jgi:flagellar hook-associated protein 3 FlgL